MAWETHCDKTLTRQITSVWGQDKKVPVVESNRLAFDIGPLVLLCVQ